MVLRRDRARRWDSRLAIPADSRRFAMLGESSHTESSSDRLPDVPRPGKEDGRGLVPPALETGLFSQSAGEVNPLHFLLSILTENCKIATKLTSCGVVNSWL